MPIPVSWPVIGGTPYSIPVTGETNWGALTNYLVALSTAQGTSSQKVGARIATATPIIITSATDCAVVVDLTIPGPSTVQLPPGVNGQFFSVSDGKGDAGVNNITVLPGVGATINGDPSFTINSNDDAIGLIYTSANNNWKVTSQILSFSPGSVARNAIQAGTPNYVVINAPVTGLLSEEQFLATIRGGFGTDVSSFTGLVKASLGSFTASALVDADVSATANINATKLGTGGVNNAEFNRVPQMGRYAATTKITGGVASVNGGNPALFDLSGGTGQIIDYVSDPLEPDYIDTTWPNFTAQTLTNLATADITYILVNSAGSIIQQTTFPTPAQRRQNHFLSRINHSSRVTIQFIDNIGGDSVSAPNQLQDLIDALGPFNISGNVLSPNGANLNINKSAGTMFERYYNQVSTPLNPHVVTTGSLTAASFFYQTRTGTVGVSVTAIDPANYDVAGVVTAIPGPASTSTIQRVFLFPSNNIRIQYGQNTYATLADAVAAVSTESFVIAAANVGFPILIGFIALQKNTTALNSGTARFLPAARFDSGSGGGAGGTSTLQGAYNNSVSPILTLAAAIGAFNIRDNSVPLGTSLFNVQNNAAAISYIDVSTQGIKSNQYPTANRVMITDTNSAASQSAVTSTELGYLSGTTGVTGTGSIVRNVSPVINTPDIDGGTASNTARITVPKNTYANLLTLTRKEGTILYATDLDLFFADDGISLSPIGSGGSLNTNMIANPNNATGWTRTGSVQAVPVTTTTAGDLPLGGIVSSAIQFVATGSGTEATEYVSYSVTTPATFGGKLQVNFFQRPGAGFVTGQWTVSVYQGATRQSISSDSGGVTTLSAVNGPFTFSMDAQASTAYTLRFARTSGAGSATLNVANVFFGFPSITQGVVISEWFSFTPTLKGSLGDPTVGAGSSLGWYRRVGSSIEMEVLFKTGAGVTQGSGDYYTTLPAGLTLDFSRMIDGADAGGVANFINQGSAMVNNSATAAFGAGPFVNGITNGVFIKDLAAGTNIGQNFPTANWWNNSGAGDTIQLKCTYPIAEWAGNGTVNLGPGAQVEYASNSTAFGTSNTTAFAFGPAGQSIPVVALADSFTQRVRFQYPVLLDDLVDVLIINPSGAMTTILQMNSGSSNVAWCPLTYLTGSASTDSAGISWRQVNATDIDITFGRYVSTNAAGAAFGYGGISAGLKWVARKSKSSSPNGFGLASTDGSAGLVNPYTEGSGVIYSARYTPTLTVSTNVAAITLIGTAIYSRSGKIVTVSVQANISTTAAASTASIAFISLPIASNLTAVSDLTGTGTRNAAAGTQMQSIFAVADTAGDRAQLQFNSLETASRDSYITFQYEIK